MPRAAVTVNLVSSEHLLLVMARLLPTNNSGGITNTSQVIYTAIMHYTVAFNKRGWQQQLVVETHT